MSLISVLRRGLVFFVLLSIVFSVSTSSVRAQEPRLHIYTEDSVSNDQSQGIISVYISNPTDTIAGFKVWLMLSQLGVASFPADPAITLDTTGSLISGWEHVDVRSFTSERIDAQVVGLAEYDVGNGTVVPGIPSGQDGGLLFRLFCDLDVLPAFVDDSCARIIILTSPADNMSFSDPSGQSIGLTWRTVIDSTFFCCSEWSGETCLSWTDECNPPYDSCEAGIDSFPYIDTMYVDSSGAVVGSILVESGNICTPLREPCCGLYTGGTVGNCNCSEDGAITLSDIVLLIDRVYVSRMPLRCEDNGNANGDTEGRLTLSDLTALIDHVYVSRQKLPDCPAQ